MAAQIIPLSPAQGVSNSGLAIFDLRNLLGYLVKGLHLQLGGTAFTKSMIQGVQLKINSKVVYDSTGPRIDARSSWRGVSANAAFLTIDFTEPRAKTLASVIAGALDCATDVRDIRLEVMISGATAPTLAGYAEVLKADTAPELAVVRPLIGRVHSASQFIGSSGTVPLIVPHLDPLNGGTIFKRIAIFSANMTGVRVERSGVRELEFTSVAALNYTAARYGCVPQAGLVMLDFIADGFLQDRALDTRPMSGTTIAAIYGTFSAAENITVEVEVTEPLQVY